MFNQSNDRDCEELNHINLILYFLQIPMLTSHILGCHPGCGWISVDPLFRCCLNPCSSSNGLNNPRWKSCGSTNMAVWKASSVIRWCPECPHGNVLANLACQRVSKANGMGLCHTTKFAWQRSKRVENKIDQKIANPYLVVHPRNRKWASSHQLIQ